MKDQFNIPTYIINLKERKERLNHILGQFRGRNEFHIQVVEACEHKIGAIGLWRSIVKVIELAQNNNDDVIIICEDDHEFTHHYSQDFLLYNLINAHRQGAEIISGGIGGYGHAIPLTENRFWVSSFLSTQFIIVYKKFFKTILSYEFKEDDVTDLVLSDLTSHKMVLYPFISSQKDFGYSDITAIHNEKPGLVQRMFKKTEMRFQRLQNAYIKYSKS